ncbi:MAG: hypothetical protein AAFO29_17940 [Actinomycetota bacterium]
MESPEVRLQRALGRIGEVTKGRSPSGVGHDDADDEVGTIASDDAIGFDPLPLLRSLDATGAEVMVIGQVAGILHGSTELTGDLDLLWSGRPADAAPVAAGFGAVDATLWDDDGSPVEVGDDAFRLSKVVFQTATAAGDCCTPALPWGGLDVTGFLARAERATIDGVVVRYLTLADLIEMREAVGRPKDLRRAAELRALASDR